MDNRQETQALASQLDKPAQTLKTAQPARKNLVRLVDYAPPAFSVTTIDLTVKLFDDEVIVAAEMQIVRHDPSKDSLWLDGGPYMQLDHCALDGQVLMAERYDCQADGLLVHGVGDAFQLSLQCRLKPDENTRLEGLYRSKDIYCTQCEAEGFRHICYFIDRPDNMTRYRVRIEGDKKTCPVLLSNGNLLEEGALEKGRHYALWEDPFPKPCYLFALVAGDLACLQDYFITQSGRRVTLNIYAAHDHIMQCDHAMWSLKEAMRWDEEEYGREYDLDLYNIVAVSDFNMGAMENKGLNIFNSKYVLASPKTASDDDYDHITGVIAHEYFHNWTGNRITCRDWFQLSLKEGLTVYRDQEFSADIGSRALKRLDDVRQLRFLQFAEDASPLAHPVRPDHYVEINNFYTATVYNKGAELIRMLALIEGREAFRAGMDLYFERHDGQAVTCEDFIKAHADASGYDFKDFFRWYEQAGTPLVTVKERRDGAGHVRFDISQSCAATPNQDVKQALVIPLALAFVDEVGTREKAQLLDRPASEIEEFSKNGLIILKKEKEVFHFSGVSERAVASLLRGFSAPVRLEFERSATELALLARSAGDGFSASEAAGELAYAEINDAVASLRRGDPFQPSAVWLDLIENFLKDKKMDQALLADILLLPSESELAQRYNPYDPGIIHAARQIVLQKTAACLAPHFIRRFNSLIKEEPEKSESAKKQFNIDVGQASKAKRRLKASLLNYSIHLPEGHLFAAQIYQKATNMTDRMIALNELVHQSIVERDQCLQDFYERFKTQDLVIDKWFAVQAISQAPDSVERLSLLKAHPAFTMKNPNRVRALVASFAYRNPHSFHAIDGSGYAFLGRFVAELDQINPQVAARLIAPFGQWRRLETVRSNLMKEQLEILDKIENISNDVRELVNKSLN